MMYTFTNVFLAALAASGVITSPVVGRGIPLRENKRASTGSPTPAKMQPVMQHNFADPALIEVDNITYTFATTTNNINVPIAHQLKGQDMQLITTNPNNKLVDAMPTLPKWSTGDIWAPDVMQLADGSFVLYFAGAAKSSNKHCVGTATSKTVTGPYVPNDTAFTCPLDQGGAIDPAGFTDTDGSLYVVYKIDGNSLSAGNNGPCGNADGKYPTPLLLQQVQADGVTKTGDPVQLLDRSKEDGPLIEAPSLVKSKEGVYVLFFSSNCFNGPLYDTSYATSQSLKGPYTKTGTPLLVSGQAGLMSPGGTTVGKLGDRIVFHADAKYSDPTVRQMYMSGIGISGTTVTLVS